MKSEKQWATLGPYGAMVSEGIIALIQAVAAGCASLHR